MVSPDQLCWHLPCQAWTIPRGYRPNSPCKCHPLHALHLRAQPKDVVPSKPWFYLLRDSPIIHNLLPMIFFEHFLEQQTISSHWTIKKMSDTRTMNRGFESQTGPNWFLPSGFLLNVLDEAILQKLLGWNKIQRVKGKASKGLTSVWTWSQNWCLNVGQGGGCEFWKENALLNVKR
jgi:hypothetical protein